MAYMQMRDNMVPAGDYQCKFLGTEEIQHKEYGDRKKWEFEVDDGGPQHGKKVSGWTGPDPTPTNKCGDFLAAIVGCETADKAGGDPDDHIGGRYLVTARLSETGKSSVVAEFRRLAATPPAAAVATPELADDDATDADAADDDDAVGADELPF